MNNRNKKKKKPNENTQKKCTYFLLNKFNYNLITKLHLFYKPVKYVKTREKNVSQLNS